MRRRGVEEPQRGGRVKGEEGDVEEPQRGERVKGARRKASRGIIGAYARLLPLKRTSNAPRTAMPFFSSNKPDQHDAEQSPQAPSAGLWSIVRQPAPRQAAPSRRAGIASQVIAPPPAAGTAASTLLKRYRPLQTRAAGGFGSVEICLDSRLQRRVAIKRMPLASPYNRTSQETTATALAEARTASMLQHPNIVQVIDFSYDSAYAYLVMEYVDGMSLEEFLAHVDGHSLTYDEATAIADALVQALAFAHENGVLHLDIKPANVLIDRSGHVKLADFGMATLASAAGFGGARGGTIGYMAPEQLSGLEVDERSDVFSLAAVLYESLCATAPFRAGTPADSLNNIEKGVIYPSDLLPDIPETTEGSLLTALSPEASDRMNSANEFGDWFCANLGNAREGRKSLARIITRLTSDDAPEDASEREESEKEQRVWELDPAEGYLGSRDARSRRFVQGALSGIAVAFTAYVLLGTMRVADPLTHLLTAAGIGLAAAIAPQIGSALTLAGWLMLIVSNTPLLAVLPTAILSVAVAASWWLVWGRTQLGASVAFATATALALACGDATLAAPLAVAAAAYFLPVTSAAVSTAVGLACSRLFLAAVAAEGALPVEAAASSLFDLSFLIPAAGLSATAALASWVLGRTWTSHQEHRGTRIVALVYALLPIASFALRYLAHPMEIDGARMTDLAAAAGLGILSSILIWLFVYLLGYKRDTLEGDRS